MTHSRIRSRSVVLVAALAAVAFFGQLSGIAQAVVPSGSFLNPDVASTDGPYNVVAEVPDGTDSLYHFVVRAIPNDGGQTVTSVEIQIDVEGDGFGDADDVSLDATQVGSTDTWEAKWNIPASAFGEDGDVRAFVTDSAAETAFVPGAAGFDIQIRDGAGIHTLEITQPANGQNLGFFGGVAIIRGTSSELINDSNEVDLFVTDDGPNGTAGNTVWAFCGQADDDDFFTENPDDTNTWSGPCDLAGPGFAPGDVTAVAAVPDSDEDGDPFDLGGDIESGDAHRTTGFVQTVTAVEITPATDSQSINFCNTFTLRVLDQSGNDILGVNADVHATGPDDDLQFAENFDDEGERSDDFLGADAGAHSATDDPAAACDDSGETDDVPDDEDDEDQSDGDCTTAPPESGCQSEHDTGDATADTKHIETDAATDADGFQFSIVSETAGSTSIFGWADTTENDVHNAATEPSDTADKTWVVPEAQTVDAEPEEDFNEVTGGHCVDAVVTDADGNPIGGRTVHFRVMAGPNSDEDLDGDVGTPLGYFSEDTSDPDGTADDCYTDDDGGGGTDEITVWVNAPGDFDFDPEAGEPSDDVLKHWFDPPPATSCLDFDPNYDINNADEDHPVVGFVTDGDFDAAGDAADAIGEIDNDCDGDPIEDVAIEFRVDDDDFLDVDDVDIEPDTDGDPNFETKLTDANGEATVTIVNPSQDVSDDFEDVNIDADVLGVAVENDDEDIFKDYVEPGTAAFIECEPDVSTNVVGDTHTMTATVTDPDGDPVAGEPVDFYVDSGVHDNDDLDSNPATGLGYFGDDVLTDGSGQASASYVGTDPGLDDVITCLNDKDLGDDEDSPFPEPIDDDNDKLWLEAGELEDADVELDKDPEDDEPDAGGEPGTDYNDGDPGEIDDCDADLGDFPDQSEWDPTGAPPVNSVQLVCVSAEVTTAGPNLGAQLIGREVTLTSAGVGGVTDDPTGAGAGASATAIIEADGYARFYVVSTDIGTQTHTASVDGVTDTDTGTNDWFVDPDEARELDCEPDIDTNTPGTDHEILCTVTDGLDNPVQFVTGAWTKTDSGGASSTFGFQSVTTDVNGQVRATINSPSEGTTEVTFTIPAFTECDEAAGVPHTGDDEPPFFGSWDTGKGAGNCTYTVKKIWKTPTVTPPVTPTSCPEDGGYKVKNGTKGDDKLKGDNGCNKLKGKKGDDKLSGKGEDDLLVGGQGDDKCIGGLGDDRFRGCEKIKKGDQTEIV